MQRFTIKGYEFRLDKDLKKYYLELFKKRAAWRSDYRTIANWITKNLDAKTYGDLGCGNAQLITELHKLGKKVWGIDAAPNFERYVDPAVRPYVKKANLTASFKSANCEAALCFEVAERIDDKYADTLVRNIAGTKADTILFTAAEPGQAGILHVNLQPHSYWLKKFSRHDYYLDAALTQKFKDELEGRIKKPVWYLDDIMILQKCDSQKQAAAYKRAEEYIAALKEKLADLQLKNKKLKHMEQAYWVQNQHLNSVLSSRRWQTSTKLMKVFKR